MIRGVIFDLDGVLTDTAELHYRAWKKLADEEGWPFDRRINERLRGVSRRASLEIILDGRRIPEEQMVACMERKNRYYQEMLDSISPADLYPGVRETIRFLKAHRVRIGVGSASRNAPRILRQLQIAECFDFIGDGGMVDRTKPEADIFVFVAGALGVPVSECLVVEDAEAGIAAARVCGMHTIGIGPRERVGAAEHRYDCIGDIDWENIIIGEVNHA